TNTATGRAQSLTTTEDGRYRAVALVPGPYEVSAELQGFGTLKRNITLVVGAEADLDLKLGVANLAETITVTGETPLVETAKSQPSSVITGAQLEALPVLSRDFLVLAQLLPGAGPISRASQTNGTRTRRRSTAAMWTTPSGATRRSTWARTRSPSSRCIATSSTRSTAR